jgi:hypothetical protein
MVPVFLFFLVRSTELEKLGKPWYYQRDKFSLFLDVLLTVSFIMEFTTGQRQADQSACSVPGANLYSGKNQARTTMVDGATSLRNIRTQSCFYASITHLSSTFKLRLQTSE